MAENNIENIIKKAVKASEKSFAKTVEKTLRSAIANAVNRDEENPVDAEDLYISMITADEGRDLRRIRPRARGAADRIKKRHSHITVIVSDGVDESEPPVETAAVSESEE